MFLASWLISVIALLSVVMHCWTTRDKKQPYLLASKVALMMSIALAIPYTWELPLQRYRLIGNIVINLLCAIILLTAFL